MKKQLHDRINRVINTEAFEKALEVAGLAVFDFQMSWAEYDSFEKLPDVFQRAILAGESELSSPLAQLI